MPKIYRGWRIVFLAFLLQLLATGPVYYAFGSYSLLFQENLGANRTEVNFAYSLLLFFGAVGAAPLGWALDRWPVKWIGTIGLALTASGLALLTVASSITQVMILFGLVIGIGDVMTNMVTTNFLVTRWFERRRGLAIGLAMLGASVAAIVFPPLTPSLINAFGWREMFFVYAAVTASAIIPMWVLGRVPDEVPLEEQIASAAGQPSETREQRVQLGLRQIVSVSGFWIVSVSIGIMIGVTGATTITLVPYAVGKGFSEVSAATLISLLGMAAFAGKLVFGAVADRIDLRWALRAALITMTASCLLYVPAGSYTLLAAASILFGLGVGGMLPLWGVLVGRIFGSHNCGKALGFTRAAMFPWTILCPMIAGLSFDWTQSYVFAWYFFGAVLMLCLVGTFLRPNWAQPIHKAETV